MQLPNFSAARVLVVGDVMLDRYWSGATSRISPEAPVPVVAVNDTEDRAGGAANVAINLATLGAKVSLLGLCGDDDNARILRDKLSSYAIAHQLVAVPGFNTITKLRVMSRHQQLLRMDFERSFAAVEKQAVTEAFSHLLADADVVVLSDYNKGTLSHPQPLIQRARAQGKTVIIDPKGNDFDKYRGASLITPNLAELFAVSGTAENEETLCTHAQRLRQHLDLDALLLTRSEQGMSLFTAAVEPFHLPAKAREVYDVTGAGDTVVSTLAASLAVGTPLQDACVLANLAASVVVGKLGTSTVSTTELALAMGAEATHLDGGVLNEAQLLQAVALARRGNARIVMTNGCFDILHAGHVSYLNAAAKLGDRLIVAVNTDDSVKRLKGPGRPVNNVQRRMAVLAGLAAVDWVVPFSEETPQRLIAEVLPDVLVKGGDYQVTQIAGAAEVLANGGEVKVLHFEEGVSTTAIIEQIVQGR